MKDYTKLSPEEKEALVQKAVQVAFDTETDYGNCILAQIPADDSSIRHRIDTLKSG